MRFELDEDQHAIVHAVDGIMRDRGGAGRARALGGDQPAYDHDLERVLRESGYLGFRFGSDAGPLEAALVVGAVARGLGVVATGTAALIVPGALDDDVRGPIAIAAAGTTGPVRFAGDAATLLAVGDDRITIVDLDADATEPVKCRYGYPAARVMRWNGRELDRDVHERVRCWWRVSLALELAATMRVALDSTVAHVGERLQFGRPIGSFQVVQHRLAECEVLAQGSQLLALEAAWSGAQPEASAGALTYALRAADRVFWETHQFTGALGFAEEYDLHLSTMRIPALRAEAFTSGTAARDVSALRWSAKVS